MDVWSITKEMLTYKPMGRTEVEWHRRKQDNSETEREVYVVGMVARVSVSMIEFFVLYFQIQQEQFRYYFTVIPLIPLRGNCIIFGVKFCRKVVNVFVISLQE